MAGGHGQRLWPVSRDNYPKQCLTIGGNKSLLQLTFERVLSLSGPENIYVITTHRYAELVEAQLPDLERENIINEPFARASATCLGLALNILLQRYQRDDLVIVAVPSDLH